MPPSGAQVGDPHVGQPVLPLEQDRVVAEEVEPLQHHVGAVGQDLLPAPTTRVRHRGADEAEVAAGVVDPQIEVTASVVDLVLLVRDPRRDEAPLALGMVGEEEACLRGGEAVDLEEEQLPAPGSVDADVESRVLLLVDEIVLRASDRVAVEPVVPLGLLVLDRVEQGPVVGGPGHRPRPLRHRLAQLARLEVLHEERVPAKPGGVRGVGQQSTVVGHLVRPESHEGLVAPQVVEVEGDLLGRVVAVLPPTVDRVLKTLDGPRVVPPRALSPGHALVRLLDAAQHLLVEPLPQRPEGLEDRGGVGVLGFEMGPHLRVRLVAQPGVLVRPAVAVDLADPRHPLRQRRHGSPGGIAVAGNRWTHGREVEIRLGGVAGECQTRAKGKRPEPGGPGRRSVQRLLKESPTRSSVRLRRADPSGSRRSRS